MKNVKVLFLDQGEVLLKLVQQSLAERGIQLVSAVRQADLAEEDVYMNSPATLQKVTELTRREEVDCVIIGNNLGTGVPKARAVAENMRAKTIIAWNDYRPGDEQLYFALGFRHFCSRLELPKVISTVLGIRV